MPAAIKKYPFYLRSTVVLFGLVLFVFVLWTLQGVLIPLAFGALLAVLLNPLVNKLEKWKLHKVLAITIALVLATIAIGLVAYFLSSQIASFSDQLPTFKQKFTELFHTLQQSIASTFNVDVQKQDEMVKQAESNLKPVVGQAIGTLADVLELLLLIPLYAFLMLFYKTLLLNFVYEVFADADSKEVGKVLVQTKSAIQSYTFGLMLEALVMTVLNSTALLLLGVKYAILLGLVGAILNVLPFIGGIVSTLLPLVIATITKDGYGTQIGIIISYLAIQFVDNHFLVPYIVSSKVKINALISILIVLMGGLLWGVAGMFLSIPFIGVLKIIFDRVPELKPWGKLLGDEVPTRHKGQIRSRKAKAIGE